MLSHAGRCVEGAKAYVVEEALQDGRDYFKSSVRVTPVTRSFNSTPSTVTAITS